MKILYYSLCLTLLLASCQREIDEFELLQPVVTDSAWAITLPGGSEVYRLFEGLESAPEEEQIRVDNNLDQKIMLRNNFEMDLPPEAFEANGSVLSTGNVTLRVLLLRKKGDLIRFRKPTVSNRHVLETGGVLFVQAKRENVIANIRAGKKLRFRYLIPKADPAMRLFYGRELGTNPGDNFNWELSTTDTVQVIERRDSSQTGGNNPLFGYELSFSRLGWINVDKFTDTTQSTYSVGASLPPGFQNRNTSVFMVFKDLASVLMLYPDASNRLWAVNRIPQNQPFMLISLSRNQEKLFLGVADSKGVTANQHFNIRPQPRTQAEIRAFLDSL